MLRPPALLPALLLLLAIPALAQETPSAPAGGASPAALGQAVVSAWGSGDTVAFDALHPDPDARRMLRLALQYHWPTRPGSVQVMEVTGGRAVLRLSGTLEVGNTGDETMLGRFVSGLFEAERAGEGWRLARRVPMDEANRIRRQALDVALEPGAGLEVRDTLLVDVGSAHGFWAMLNRGADLREVSVGGRAASYSFEHGLLWVDLPPGEGQQLVLDYGIDVARESAERSNSGRFEAEFGHVRSQYFWHPFFDFSSAGTMAEFRVRVRAPAEVHLTTSLPQSSRQVGDVRFVDARSAQPTFGLSLLYDRGWEPLTRQYGGLTADLFVAPGFDPATATLDSALARSVRTLATRFGAPAVPYLAVAQSRARSGSGWHYRSNELVAAGRQGGRIVRAGGVPRAWFGHEVAHGWTRPTGAGMHFLSEGWATYAEAVLLEEEFGPAVADDFWEAQRNNYLADAWDGRLSILEDAANEGIAYPKGAWVLHMLEQAIGREAFDAGMRAYAAIPAGQPSSIVEFTLAMSGAAGRDLAPWLRPWLEERTIPRIGVRVEGDEVVLVQDGPVFDLALEVDLVTATDTVRRSVQLRGRDTAVPTAGLAGVREVLLDPAHRLLLHRTRGEVARFELSAPGAKAVVLGSDFSRQELAATERDGVWVVEVPLLEGRYIYWWMVDGEYRAAEDGGVRVVRPLTAVLDGQPR